MHVEPAVRRLVHQVVANRVADARHVAADASVRQSHAFVRRGRLRMIAAKGRSGGDQLECRAWRIEAVACAVEQLIRDGRLEPSKLIGKTVSLEQGAIELTNMNSFLGSGVKVIAEF